MFKWAKTQAVEQASHFSSSYLFFLSSSERLIYIKPTHTKTQEPISLRFFHEEYACNEHNSEVIGQAKERVMAGGIYMQEKCYQHMDIHINTGPFLYEQST